MSLLVYATRRLIAWSTQAAGVISCAPHLSYRIKSDGWSYDGARFTTSSGIRGGGHGDRGGRVKMEMRREGDKIHGRGVGRPSTGAAPNDRRKTHNSHRLHPIPSRMRELAILIPNHPSPPPLPAPMADAPHGPTTHRRGFFSLSADKVHFLRLPEASPRRQRCGSSHGWLAITDESPVIFLLNPLTRAKVLLPPLSSFSNVVAFNFYDVGCEYTLCAPNGDTYTLNLKQMRDFFIKKVILSSSPSSDDNYIAFVILNQTGDLAFCKNGDQSWKFIEDAKSYCEDVIYLQWIVLCQDGSIEPLPCYPRNSISQLRWPPPIWVTPNPY
ncbi:hypothetical protein Acr_21g0010610 [Actinidia rufa]|uniref:KIB1-4 beta-propeller domain-containing protein n=1 Tax=Actinidia rufa TaxID=165716 RepID=A0A7J0GI92_9ERIC|nr:hypothetical protein Acr_21g0010610 [Actinidia rufa]